MDFFFYYLHNYLTNNYLQYLVFAFALLCSTSLVAQFSFNANGTGIESPTNTASGNTSTAMGFKPKQVEIFRLLWVIIQLQVERLQPLWVI